MSDEYKELRKEYLKDIRSRLRLLKNDIQTKNIYAVVNFIHRLKGTGATFGYFEFAEITKEMEDIMGKIDWEKLSQSYSKLNDLLIKITAEDNV